MNRQQITGRPAFDELTIEAKVKSSTEKNKLKISSIFNRLKDCTLDSAKAIRVLESTCRFCYYIDEPVVLQSFVKIACENCNKIFFHGDSHTPVLCRDCGTKYQACLWCYGDIDA